VKKACLIVAVCVVAVVTLSSCRSQEESQGALIERDPVFEQEIYDRLTVIAPDAVSVFKEATETSDAGDLEAAKRGYERVLELAPDFPDALRRLSHVELSLGNIDVALERAERALAVDESPYNHVALAGALLATEESENAKEALAHAWTAVEDLPDDDYANAVLLSAGAVNNDMRAIRQSTEKLLEIWPEYPFAHYVAGILATDEGKWILAERELLLAQELGMPAQAVQEALDDGIAYRARRQRVIRAGIYAVASWLAGLLGLFLVGMLLSKLTLAAVERAQPMTRFELGKGERLVRRIYRVVIALTGVYFYISIPFMILAVVAVAVAFYYLFMAIGRIPLQFAALLLGAVVYTLVAVVRGVFARVEDEELGRLLPREEAPQLWEIVEQVAERVGTRPVDVVYVTPAASIAVLERGGLLKKLRGAGQRNLILGLGALPGMTQGQFKAILAHEYGHFSERDTAGGNLARQVRHAMHRMAYTLAVNGQARWYNPAWLFINGFHRVFLRITLGASRLQEVLADRYAALTYGVESFIDGLTHIVRQSLAFDLHLSQKVGRSTHIGLSLPNLYASAILPDHLVGQLETKVNSQMSRPTSPYDSHPALQDRIKFVRQIDAANEVEESTDPVWNLFPNAEALQKEMMDIIRADVKEWQQRRAAAEASRRGAHRRR
jgi:Zn-dependent protease with chaperone function/Tfp pilus assembly protein PilF